MKITFLSYFTHLVSVFSLLAFANTGLAQQSTPGSYPDPSTRFEDYVASTVAADSETPPPRGAIVCVGSSSMRMWELDIVRDLYPLTLIKRGFGGSNFADALFYVDELVLKHEPRAILVYEGDNDIGGSKVPPVVALQMAEAFIQRIHASLPDTRIYFISPKPSPRRLQIWPVQQDFNQMLEQRCAQDDRLFFIDVAPVMMNDKGEPAEALFKNDMLHMNRDGYRLWKSVVRPVLMENELKFETRQPVELVRQWELSDGLLTPESVFYHAGEDVLFVSNIGNGTPTDHDGDGFISKVSLNGRILDLKWATGLDAPKGIAVHGSHLYVADINQLVRIDLDSGEVSGRYPAETAQFLNDVAADQKGNVIVGDTSAENSVLYRLQRGKLAIWLDKPEIARPNGLSFENGDLIAGNVQDNKLHSIDLLSKETKFIADSGSRIDGLEPLGDGRYLTSDWLGRISFIDSDGSLQIVQDTTSENINAADFEFVARQKLLIVPTFFDNRLVAYLVKIK